VIVGFCSCDSSSTKKGNLSDFIPENTSVIFKISKFEVLQTDIKNNDLLSSFSNTSPYTFFSENSILLKHLHPTSSSLLCVNKLNDSTTAYTFITKETPGLFVVDSLGDKTIETLSYNNKTIQRITLGKQSTYTAVQDSVFIASSSQQILQDVLEGKTNENPTFQKIYNLKDTRDLTAILQSSSISLTDSTKINFASWTSLGIEILPDAITATGVALANDTVPQLINVFEGLKPQQNDIANIIPNNALGALLFTYSEPGILQKNLRKFRADTISPTSPGIFESGNEIGLITFENEKAIVLKSIDASITQDALLPFISENTNFHDVEIRTFDQPNIFETIYSPLIKNAETNFVFSVDNFFVFTKTQQVAEDIITAYKNNDCLSKTTYFEEASGQLSSASSLIIISMQGSASKKIAPFFNIEAASEISIIDLEKYPLAVLQFSYDRNFAHVNFISKEVSKGSRSKGTVSEKFNITLDNEVLGSPQFFSNHKNNEKDIVVQDITNKLYLISSGGKVLWTKKLEGPLLGKIHEVDLLRNGKKQLAFTTKNKFYVLDRTGKEVAPFPLNFRDDITQPLSVFDYDNNRKYRFIITQGKEFLMYNSEGKQVKGFNFNKAKSTIVLSPQHIRIGNKDYILVAEENGKLNILSRVGKSRINISKTFKFSEISIAKEDTDFVVITDNDTKESISQDGKITSQKLKVSSSYWFAVSGNTKATLDDNLLRINGKLVELPFGIYTKPQLFTVHRNTYISVTETQENKVWVFNTSGDLLQGFPVYGTSEADLDDASNNGKPNLVVKGDAKTVIMYRMK